MFQTSKPVQSAPTWHLVWWICSLSGLRCGEAGAVAEACLQGGLTLGEAAFSFNAWKHYTKVCEKKGKKQNNKAERY